MAHPTTITGSIGVILTSINMREMIGKLGIKDVSVKSGDNKDLLNPFTDMTPEQRAMLQQLVDSLHSRFVMLVARHRELPPDKVRELADGRIFLAPHAEELGLIDGLGYVAEAEAAVEALLGQEVRFVRYSQQLSLRDLLRSPAFWGAAFSELVPRANQQPAFQLR
jgi:protease-4